MGFRYMDSRPGKAWPVLSKPKGGKDDLIRVSLEPFVPF